MISPRSIPLKYTGWKNQHSQVSSKPGRCLHVTEETVRYFDSNKWLWLVMTAVKRSGTKVEEREVYLDELGDFAECGLCGTAAVISPVGKIVDHGKEICFPSGMEEMGPVTKKLYETLTGIQMGHIEAPEGWICKIC